MQQSFVISTINNDVVVYLTVFSSAGQCNCAGSDLL